MTCSVLCYKTCCVTLMDSHTEPASPKSAQMLQKKSTVPVKTSVLLEAVHSTEDTVYMVNSFSKANIPVRNVCSYVNKHINCCCRPAYITVYRVLETACSLSAVAYLYIMSIINIPLLRHHLELLVDDCHWKQSQTHDLMISFDNSTCHSYLLASNRSNKSTKIGQFIVRYWKITSEHNAN